MAARELYIGIMSGTSLDAIDVVLVDFGHEQISALTYSSTPLPETVRQQILRLQSPSSNEIALAARLDRQIASLSAFAVNALLKQSGYLPSQIKAIGSHGQTIRHAPKGIEGYTVQVGDPNTIAELTGITTVADFRRRDIAAGGQGAPLVPPFHQAAFGQTNEARAIVNIGGMANITLLNVENQLIGFDTGPGNVLMDAWIQAQQGLSFDNNGDWAASGTINQALLERLLSLAYFSELPPKSTGREQFNLAWLQAELKALEGKISAADIQATLAMLTAHSISDALHKNAQKTDSVFLCGGGAYNGHLKELITAKLAPLPVYTTDKLGIKPDHVEAMAFAWLARQTLAREPGNCSSVTGAVNDRILGGIYYA
jgi:anhydro-N-acetylmuramic acid kinase